MRREKNKYIENFEKEEQKSFEFEEYPQLHEYYCKRMKSHKKPTKIILTEIYSPSQKQNAQINVYNSINQNKDEFYSSYKKNYFDDSALINNNANENFSKNFKYYERKNIRDNSNQKYESITRVIGHSNIIPLKTQEINKSYAAIKFNNYINNNNNELINKKKEEFNKYVSKNYKKIEQQDYRIKKEKTSIQQQNQKKEFKKPAKIESFKRTELIKKYEINKDKNKNDYKKYERKKEETKKDVKKDIKINYQLNKSYKKNEPQKKSENKKTKEIKEPKIINRREMIRKEFSVHSGRYSYKENISNDITNSRKNYNANSQEKNLKKINVVQNSNNSQNKQNKTNIVKKEEKSKKLNTNITKKININQNVTNYKRKINEPKQIQTNIKINTNINKSINTKKIDMNQYKRKNNENMNKVNKVTNTKEIKEIYKAKISNRNTTPKIEKVNFGENYRFYERKYLQSPDESCFTIHHKRSHRIIFDQDDDEIFNSYAYKSKPYIREERYNNKIISNINEPFDEDENYYYKQEGTYYY